MSRFTNYIVFWLFVLGPVVAFLSRIYLDVDYYNLMSAVVLAAFLIQFMDYILLRKKYRFPKYTLFLLAFIIYTMVSDKYLAGKDLNIKYFYSNRLISSYLILLIIENIQISGKFIKKYYKVVIIMLITAVVVIVIQQVIDKTFLVDLQSGYTKMFVLNMSDFNTQLPSILSWMGGLEITFYFISLAGVVLSIKFKQSKSLRNILLWYAMVTVFAFLSKSRWTMVNALLLFTLYPIYIKINIKKFTQYALITLLVMYGSIIVLESVNVPVTKVISDRIFEENRGGLGQGSSSSRILAFYIFAKLFPEHPFFGKGHLHQTGGNSKDYELVRELAGRSSQIHVGYLSLLYYYGLLGGALFLIFIFQFVRKIFYESKISNFWGGFIAILGFVIGNLTLVTFTIFWAGISMALLFHKYYLDTLPKAITAIPSR